MIKKLFLIVVSCVLLSACSETNFVAQSYKGLSGPDNRQYKIGKPYAINGVTYTPKEDWTYEETGIASWYGDDFHGRYTANGEEYSMWDLTAAHKTLPMPSIVKVTNLENGRTINLTVNDRGPFARGRVIDVSKRAAQLLGFEQKGTARVKVQVMKAESLALKAQITGQGISQVAVVDKAVPIDQAPVVDYQAVMPAAVEVASLDGPALNQVTVDALEGQQEALVETVPVTPTKLYIQVGSFSLQDNATKLQTKIQSQSIGKVIVSPKMVNNKNFYRVRVGPYNEVKMADAVLDKAIKLGYNSSKIIVE